MKNILVALSLLVASTPALAADWDLLIEDCKVQAASSFRQTMGTRAALQAFRSSQPDMFRAVMGPEAMAIDLSTVSVQHDQFMTHRMTSVSPTRARFQVIAFVTITSNRGMHRLFMDLPTYVTPNGACDVEYVINSPADWSKYYLTGAAY